MMDSKHPYSDELRRNVTHLDIFDNKSNVDDFHTALSFNNKPVYFFEDGQYVLAMPEITGGYVIKINGAIILHRKEIEDIENMFFTLIKNINSMLRTKVTTLKMPIPSSEE